MYCTPLLFKLEKVLWIEGMQPCLCAVCWPSEHIQPEQCEKNAAILFVSIEPLHCGGVNRGEVSITLSHPAKKTKQLNQLQNWRQKRDKVPVEVKKNNGFDLIVQCECHMTPSTFKPAHYRPQYHYCPQEDYSRKKTRRPVFIVSRHMDIVASVFSDLFSELKSHKLPN